ncbi:FemAB family protein [Flavobacterium jejuense]|uniref:FemAB family protein n=1 Tax=Flavobacterium jejuense TaxID=1544455 RepID=A0ABX0IV43_9FLAO|nr:FemAB family protein [Flavobacterium jejuense]NHN27578.1 FemAB family protein [Flavobacterium jejuense]
MKTYQVKKYTTDHYLKWNEFVANAKNATFLFHRDFMEYHSDRFEDYSLLIFDEKENLKAILPANSVGDVVYSHQGLTYGGLVFEKNVKYREVKLLFELLFQFLKTNKVKNLIYKPINPYYQVQKSEEYLFILFEKKATLLKREFNLCIPFREAYRISKSKLKHYRKNLKLDFEIKHNDDFSVFWKDVLIPRLQNKHDAKPVHSLEEIEYLVSKFPDNIHQYSIYFKNEIVAGITTFKSGKVIKSQYGATTDLGEKLRALDYLYFKLFEKYSKEFDFFDMGTCTENNELGFNEGLLTQKEELGCSLFNQDTYSITL